ncbi:hypothetical protein EG327_005855 [Venturia inaequalis]|uniref:Dynamin family protein n=2 Tax=Venturia inaequalis TaxID=5025 RepID=A0A8H3ZEG9_VENIN|nr:hypothetical protein EG327_005855 [Venturia inaequalis]
MTLMPSTYPESNSISSGMPTPDASPRQGFSSIVDSLDFGDEQKTLLDELDKLREYGVDKYIELPQLIVVGDQSSGKSSVLEAITELPFPRSSIRCTRFATQIKLRHTPDVSLRVGIIPDPKRTSAERQRLASFPSTFPPDTSFSDIMALADKYIVPDNNSSFCSKDVFSIEFTGPNKPHLTVVDLPGLIQAANNYQSQADVDSIKDLAYSYMRNPRTIILSIVSAASDLELQPVLAREARQFDPTGARTLGIITKPDKTETPEREAQFLELARNENIKFKLGWHVLRNRAPSEMDATPEQRKKTEKAFFAPPSNWSKLGPDSYGIEPLRIKLSKELVKHVLAEMPNVQREIRAKLDEVRSQLEKMGDRKDEPTEMRDELRKLMDMSGALTRTALDGQYADLYGPPFFHPTPPSPTEAIRKLRARLVIQHESFAAEMNALGHLVDITEDSSPSGPAPGYSPHPRRMTRQEFIRQHVEPLLNASPGLELRMDKNPLLVYTLFRNYSQGWDGIATNHINEVQNICNDFLQEVVDFVFPPDMRDRAWAAFVEERMEQRLDGAYAEAQKLFKDRTRAAKPYDLVHEQKVLDWVSKRNQQRQQAASEAVANGSSSALNPNAFLSDFAPDNFLQKMLVYYELTRSTFISNLIVQCCERHLVDELDRLFSIIRVMELDDEAVVEICEEDPANRQVRIDLRNKRRILEAGDRICRKYMARRDLKLDPELRTSATGASRGSDSDTANRNQPGRPTAARRQRREVPPQVLQQPQAPSYAEPQESYHTAQAPSTPASIQRAPSRATVDTHRTSVVGNIGAAEDPYVSSSRYDNHRQAEPTPNYGRYDPRGNDSEGGYVAPPPPPRPAAQPPIPPKRPDDHEEQRRSGGGLRQVFGRKP